MHHSFKVVTKAAMFNRDKSKVLVIDMNQQDNEYGLPGGHIEEGELINEAMNRELFEECGVEAESMEKSISLPIQTARSSSRILVH